LDLQTEETAKLVQSLLRAVSSMSLIALVSAILSLATGFYSGSLLWVGVVLPLIAYAGISQRSRSAVMCFAWSSGMLCLVYGILLIGSLASLGDFVTCACNAACRSDAGISNADALRICAAPSRFRALFWTHVATAVLLLVLMGYSAVLAFKVAAREHFEPPLVVLEPQVPPGYVLAATAPLGSGYTAYAPYHAPAPYGQTYVYAAGGAPQPHVAAQWQASPAGGGTAPPPSPVAAAGTTTHTQAVKTLHEDADSTTGKE